MEEQFKKLHKNREKEVFLYISKIIDMQNDILQGIYKFSDILHIDCYDLPNTAVTLNNKMVMINQMFLEKNLSMFVSNSNGCFSDSYLGYVAFYDLLDKLLLSHKILNEYFDYLIHISDYHKFILGEYKKLSIFQKAALHVDNFFNGSSFSLDVKEDQKRHIERIMKKYINIDKEIWNYSFEDYFVSEFFKEISDNNTPIDFITDKLEYSIFPDLEKLGFSNLILEIKQIFREKYGVDFSDQSTSRRNLH